MTERQVIRPGFREILNTFDSLREADALQAPMDYSGSKFIEVYRDFTGAFDTLMPEGSKPHLLKSSDKNNQIKLTLDDQAQGPSSGPPGPNAKRLRLLEIITPGPAEEAPLQGGTQTLAFTAEEWYDKDEPTDSRKTGDRNTSVTSTWKLPRAITVIPPILVGAMGNAVPHESESVDWPLEEFFVEVPHGHEGRDTDTERDFNRIFGLGIAVLQAINPADLQKI